VDELRSNRNRRTEWLCLGLILAYSVSIRIAMIDRGFHRDPEGVSAYYAILARNYIHRPISQHKGVPLQNLGRTNPPKYYGHHPPLVPALIAATYATLGFRADAADIPPDWESRFSTALFTLACIVATFLMIRKRERDPSKLPRAALLAAAIFATMPITVYYGGFPDVVGSQLVFFVLLTIAAYDRFWEAPSLKRLAWLIIAFALAAFTDWVAFFLPIILGIHFLATRRLQNWGGMAAFGVACGALFLLAYGHIAIVEHDWLWMHDKVARRAGSISDTKKAFTFFDWLCVVARRADHLFTAPLLVLTGIWIATARWIRTPTFRLVAILLAWAGLHIVVGRQGVFQHEWWWWPLAPGVAIASALVVDRWVHNSRAGNAFIVACILALAAWSTVTTVRALYKSHGMLEDDASHSVVEIGRAIRSCAPPDAAVMVAEKDASPGLWHYADRPIIVDVWDGETLEARLRNPAYADLPFGFTEEWHKPPVRFVFPKSYQLHAPAMLKYLQSHYSEYSASPDVAAKFFVFDLTRPLP